ncbi:unnamed protein product [Effrenium voratum]|nr:unnamed protein product [Effrenium voratum]
MQELRCGRFGHRAVEPEEAEALAAHAEQSAHGRAMRRQTWQAAQAESQARRRLAANSAADKAAAKRRRQLQRLAQRLERTLQAIQRQAARDRKGKRHVAPKMLAL